MARLVYTAFDPFEADEARTLLTDGGILCAGQVDGAMQVIVGDAFFAARPILVAEDDFERAYDIVRLALADGTLLGNGEIARPPDKGELSVARETPAGAGQLSSAPGRGALSHVEKDEESDGE